MILTVEQSRNILSAITVALSKPRSGQDVTRTIRGFPEVEQLHSTLGGWDLVVQLRTATMAEFDAVLERIRAIPGVRDTQTSLLVNSLTGQ